MFESLVIRRDSLANEVIDGEVVGFTLGVRHANYRGCFVSLHNGYLLTVDGKPFRRAQQSFEVNGQPPRSFAELATAVREYWQFDEEAVLHVAAPGGISAGTHEVVIQQSILTAYGYHDTDDAWIIEAPEPGPGIGNEMMPFPATYQLELSDEERGS